MGKMNMLNDSILDEMDNKGSHMNEHRAYIYKKMEAIRKDIHETEDLMRFHTSPFSYIVPRTDFLSQIYDQCYIRWEPTRKGRFALMVHTRKNATKNVHLFSRLPSHVRYEMAKYLPHIRKTFKAHTGA